MSDDTMQVQATAQRIINATRELMTEHGLLDVSLAEISQRAGTNVALVSYYFGNREGLMVALAEADAARSAGHLDRLLAAPLSPTAKIEAHVKGLIETYFERPYLHRLLQKLLREGSAGASTRIGNGFVRPVADARRTIVAEGVATGEFRADIDAQLVNFVIDGACAHIFSSNESRRVILGDGALDRAVVDRYVRTVAALVVGGLRPTAD